MTIYADARDTLSDLIDFATNLQKAIKLLEDEEREEDAARCAGPSNTDYAPPSTLAPSKKATDETEEPEVITNDPTHLAAQRRDKRIDQLRSTARRVMTETGRARHPLLNAVDAIQAALRPAMAPDGAMTVEAPTWCDNCEQYGAHNPRRPEGGKVCRFCADWRRDHVLIATGLHELPSRAIVDRHTRAGKVTDMDARAAGFRKIEQKKTA